MRPVNKGKCPIRWGTKTKFKEYGEAKAYLLARLGGYCSYCERKINANLAVEHLRPKSIYPQFKLDWDNFLLACTNCNSSKGDTDINFSEYIFPDKENSFLYFKYNLSGMLTVASRLSANDQKRALATIKLFGLAKKTPKKYSNEWKKASDLRHSQRLAAYKNVRAYLKKYKRASPAIRAVYLDCFVTIVEGDGFWSIWMQEFSSFPEVQAVIKHCIKGTNRKYFP